MELSSNGRMCTGSSEEFRLSAVEISVMLALGKGIKGRYVLSRELGLGEGVIRGAYRRLRELGLIEVLRGGSRLTPKGFRALRRVLNALGILEIRVLEEEVVWEEELRGAVAALEGEIGDVVRARDTIVRAGAKAALIIKRSPTGDLYLPLVEGYDLRREMPRLYTVLSTMPSTAKTYVVAYADSLFPCVRGLLEASALARKGIL